MQVECLHTACAGVCMMGTRLMPASTEQSADERDHYIRSTLHSGNAVVGTCAMGRDPQQGAVVDGELRVHGVDALRVVDASIMPIMPGTHAARAFALPDMP